MRFTILLILAIVSMVGCQTTQAYKPPVFSTFFGDIEKGASMADVMEVLGNPSNIHISAENENHEIWYYLSPEETATVYFLNKKVLKVVVDDKAEEE